MKKRAPIICDKCRRAGHRGDPAFSEIPALADFTPVPRKTKRHDGWTAKRQRAFIEALAATGSVKDAARAVNMTPESANLLRRAPGGESFSAAWDTALDYGAAVIEGAALDRAIHGVPVPYYHQGEQVGERRVYNERLTMWLLQHRKPETYGYVNKGNHNGEDLERAEAIRDRDVGNYDAWLEKLSAVYGHRIQQERKERLAGNVVAADFYLRQLTHMEVLIELGGGGKYLMWWANGGNGSGDDECNMGVEIAASEVTEALDEHRRKCWALVEEPDRPKPFGNRVMISQGMYGGPGKKEREALLKDARARAAQAQLMWEEAVRDQVRALSEPTEPMAADAPATPAKGEEMGPPGQPAPGPDPGDRTEPQTTEGHLTDLLRDGPRTPEGEEGPQS